MTWHVREIVRYPVKSMAGVPAESASIGWHGLEGDRRFGLRRINDRSAFPWVSASRLPELIRYHPVFEAGHAPDGSPTHVRTPEGTLLPIAGAKLQERIAERFHEPVELINFKHGIFDDATISIIDLATIQTICDQGGVPADTRRFRANIVLSGDSDQPFAEDEWIDKRLVFGDDEDAPAVHITMRDLRCMMINLNPDTAEQDPHVMKAAVRLNDNHAGVYATVIRRGTIRVGQTVRFES